jgi:hypothetical protein
LSIALILKNSDALNVSEATVTDIDNLVKLNSTTSKTPKVAAQKNLDENVIKLNGYGSTPPKYYSSYNYNNHFVTSLSCIVTNGDSAGLFFFIHFKIYC